MSAETLAVLRSMLEVLKSQNASLTALVVIAQQKAEQRVKNAQAQQSTGSSAPLVANEKDLDSKYGNPKVHFAPRDWPGDFTKGLKMSEYSAEFLDMFAEQLQYFADRDRGSTEIDEYSKKPLGDLAKYKLRDAARARGWAKRLRAGWKPPAFGDDDDTPKDDDDGFA